MLLDAPRWIVVGCAASPRATTHWCGAVVTLLGLGLGAAEPPLALKSRQLSASSAPRTKVSLNLSPRSDQLGGRVARQGKKILINVSGLCTTKPRVVYTLLYSRHREAAIPKGDNQ